MDIGTVIGLVVAVAAIALGVVFGGNPLALIDIVSIFVVLIGTIGAVTMCFPLARITKLHTVVMQAIFSSPPDPIEIIKDLVKYAELARREGILSLENMTGDMKDPFIVRGIKMAVDGTDPELIKDIMDTELEALMDRHAAGKGMLDAIAKYAPAYGMIGTLLGLIFMLQSMDDPAAIGPGMAVALITTLYGAMLANLFAGPFSEKLAAKDAEEVLVKTIIVSGVMAIQSGDNPRVVQAKLATFLPPNQRDAVLEAA
ncbi:MAG: MotA/TolQ/ExbB proton channel family protein [Planctomycetota bacterium]